MDLSQLKFTETHEWVFEQDNIVIIGITDYAQKELGDIVYVDISGGEEVIQFERMGDIESVKAVSELEAPVSGEIIEINSQIKDTPEIINQSAFEDGWIAKIQMTNSSELDKLIDYSQYKDLLNNL